MEESEIEEGEAGTYVDENDQDIDPDVAFAYIGEKLHELLGHCQKEFEGCFTAENLGPKFGAYGSFLPTIQRSTPLLHPMAPQLQDQNHFPKSTAVLMAQDGCSYFAVPSTARQKEQHELGTAIVAKLPAVLSTIHDSVNKDTNWKPVQVTELNSKSEDAKQLLTMVPNVRDSVQKDASINLSHVEGINTESGASKKSVKLADRKPIRVRITMNSKKLLPQNNVATISSPCPSADLLGINTTRGKVVSLGSQDIKPESPHDIIRRMTASPVPGRSILSPLPEYLTNLTRNEKQQKNFSISGGLTMTEDWPDSRISMKNLKHNKKKPHATVGGSTEESPTTPHKRMAASRSVEKGNSDLDVSEREPHGLGPNRLVGPANEKQNGTVKKCQSSRYKTSVYDEPRPSVNDCRHLSGLPIEEKPASREQDVIKTSSRAPEGGKRSEECRVQHIPLHTPSKGRQIVGSSLKSGKIHSGSVLNNNNSQSLNRNVQMGFEKTKDTYKEIFGESSTEEEDNELAYHRMSAECVSKKSEVVFNKKTASIDKSEDPSSSKNLMEPVALNGSTPADFGAAVPVDDSNADNSVAAASLLILDNWVSCDRCKKWRLLPLYADTSSLPDKWTCRMINWLPGMNHCQISEEDTTKAVHALYEFHVPENQTKADVGLHGVTSRVSTSKVELPGKSFSSVSVPVAKKKKHISTNMSESVDIPCTKLQSKPIESGMEKMMVQRPKKKIFTDGGDTKINRKIENRRENNHVGPRASDVLCTGNIWAEQDQSIYKDYVPLKNLKTKKNMVQVPAKRPNAKLPVSSNDSSLEMQIIDGSHLVNKKRKVGEHSEEAGQQAQVNRPSHEAFSQDDHRRKKKVRPNQYGLNDFISSEGNSRPHVKDDTLIDHKSSKGLGTNLSKANVYVVNPGKQNLGLLKSNAPESSSSKVSGSQKPKTDIEGVQASPVGSISSSSRRRKKDKHQIRKKGLLRQDDLVDKPLLRKFEDKPLQSADKSNSSCTISGSKEDVSSGKKQREKRNKVLLNNADQSCKRETDTNISSESRQTGHFKSVVLDVKADFFSSDQTLPQQIVEGGSQCRLLAEDNQMDTSSGIMKLPSRTASKDQNDNTMRSSQDAPKFWQRDYLCTAPAAATNDDDLRPCLVTKSGNQRVNQLAIAAPPTPDKHRKDVGDPNPGPIKKDLPNEATFVEKEARRLKYLADRLGEAASASERVGIYFQSALKFLNAASLYESGSCETARHDDRNQATQIYRSTTKLFEFCAAEYEKLNTMCAVALAYKCMEVACLRVVYSSHSSAGKDQLELQTALRPVPPGESPSSCVSDVDNLNNVATVDQASLTRGAVASPLATGGLIIPARNRPNLMQFFTFTEDIDLAMDSTQKSHTAFMAAKTNSDNIQGISLVKRAIDFSFQDVHEFITLVRVAMEAISSI